jgi:hypothetical protein
VPGPLRKVVVRLKREQNDGFPKHIDNLASAITTLEEHYTDLIIDGVSQYYDNSDNIKIYIDTTHIDFDNGNYSIKVVKQLNFENKKFAE